MCRRLDQRFTVVPGTLSGNSGYFWKNPILCTRKNAQIFWLYSEKIFFSQAQPFLYPEKCIQFSSAVRKMKYPQIPADTRKCTRKDRQTLFWTILYKVPISNTEKAKPDYYNWKEWSLNWKMKIERHFFPNFLPTAAKQGFTNHFLLAPRLFRENFGVLSWIQGHLGVWNGENSSRTIFFKSRRNC